MITPENVRHLLAQFSPDSRNTGKIGFQTDCSFI